MAAATDDLLPRLISAREDERRRIARELHDQLGQQITALRMHLRAWRTRCHGDASLDAHADRTERLAEDLDRAVDALTWQLTPAVLERHGLSEALEQLVLTWSEQFGISGTIQVCGRHRARLRRDVEANVYRIVQEALHNVVKHAQATRVAVMVTSRRHDVVLAIEDNGVGFELATRPAPGRGLGLISMRERATLVGARFEIVSSPGRGTGLHVTVPRAMRPA